MDLNEVIEVVDLTSISEVNEHLQQDWILLNTYTTCYEPEISKEHQILHYSLGLTATAKIAIAEKARIYRVIE